MYSLPSTLHRFTARLLAAVVLMLGLLDPTVTLADTLQDHAPSWCESASVTQPHAPLASLSDFEISENGTDLEQLLRPLPEHDKPTYPVLAEFPPLAALLPPHLSPPLLRPPASLN